jgi:phospholipase/carboxylesterase
MIGFATTAHDPAQMPRLPALSGPARALVMLLHGYGADGDDLIEIASAWRQGAPAAFADIAFAAPHAPDPCGMGGGGREWFPLTFRDPHEMWRGVNAAAPALDRVIDLELARLNLPHDRLVLVGFSQGTMMALHVGLRRQPGPAAILGYSGLLVGPTGQPPESMAHEIRTRPPVFLIHGDADEVVPPTALFMSTKGLAALDVPVQWHLGSGLAHGIDETGLEQGRDFVLAALRHP